MRWKGIPRGSNLWRSRRLTSRANRELNPDWCKASVIQRCAGEGLCNIGSLAPQLLRQSQDGSMPELGIGVREQAIHDLAQPHPSPVLRNKIQDGKAAKSIRWGDNMPAGHCLPQKLEQVVKPLGTTTRRDRFGLCPFDDRFDLRGE